MYPLFWVQTSKFLNKIIAHLVKLGPNPKYSKAPLTATCSIMSKHFLKSIAIISPVISCLCVSVMICISFKMLLKIFQPSMNPVWYVLIISFNIGFNLLSRSLEMILWSRVNIVRGYQFLINKVSRSFFGIKDNTQLHAEICSSLLSNATHTVS